MAAKKKTTKKKAARGVVSKGFDILTPNGKVVKSRVTEKLRAMSERRKYKPTSFRTLAEVRQEIVPVYHFYMQHLFDCLGYPLGGFMQIIGDSKLGKSTMGHYFLGCAMREFRCPTLAVHWKVKPFLADRALRTMSSVPSQAKMMVERMDQTAVSTLQEMEQAIDDWVHAWRVDAKLPNAIPLVVLIDNASKYLSPEEAAGVVDWNKYMMAEAKKKQKETGAGSNFTSSKWWHAYTRKLGDFMPENNVTMIPVVDQNDEVDLSSGFGSFTMSESHATLHNDTVRGGRGMKQIANSRLIFGYKKQHKEGQDVTGIDVNIRSAKSTFGIDNRTITGELRSDHRRFDRQGEYLDPAWHFDNEMCMWFANNGFLGTKSEQGKYSSPELGVHGTTPQEFSFAFHSNEALVEKLGRQLRIQGYFDVTEDVIQVAETQDEAQ